MINPKLIKSYNCPVDFIEALPDVKADIKLLINEYNSIDRTLFSVSMVQDKFGVMQNNTWYECIQLMPTTKSTVESLRHILPFNSVYYRVLKPNTCYNWHIDTMKTCLHIPLITNFGCKFVYSDKVFTMLADGTVYIVNNSIYHTFINAGNTDRVHLTMDIF